MIRQSLLVAVTACLAWSASTAQPTQVYSHGDPTNDEQYMLELVNRARANPTEEGIRLMDTDDQSVQFAYQFFNINKAATKQAFTTYPERPPLVFHPALTTAARNHTADMIQNNFQGHVSSNGDQLNQRYQKVGYQSQGMFGENVAAYSNSVWHGHCGLNVDWGEQNQIDLGHRENIMNFKNFVFTEIGIGITRTNGGLQQGTVGPYVVTQTFGIRAVRYITGVVYNDANRNGFYDPGEGLPGVEVKPNRGTNYAVTSSSGGYAIPFTGNGAVTVTASGGDLASPMTTTVTFNGENIKVDFVPASSAPAPVTLVTPTAGAANVTIPVVFRWTRARGASNYEIQISTSQAFGGAPFTETTTDTTLSVSTLPCGQQLFWRVRAENEQGWGEWSQVANFRTSLVTSLVQTLVSPIGGVSYDSELRTIEFRWSAPANPALRYHLEIRQGATLVYEDSTITENSAVVTNVPLTDGRYDWRVRAANECGWHAFSAARSFNVTLVSVDESTIATGFHMPSPMRAGVRVMFPNTQQWMQLHIVAIDGSTVLHLPIEMGQASIESTLFASLPVGSYTAVLRGAQGITTSRFVVVR